MIGRRLFLCGLLGAGVGAASPALAQRDPDRDADDSADGEFRPDRNRNRDEDRDRDRNRNEPREGQPDARDREARPDRWRPGQAEDEGTEEGMPAPRFAPPGMPGPVFRGWWLGVYATNTQTGVRVTRVLPRSAAAEAGIERGDKIVTVDGYQIGFVNDRLFPLGSELQRRAGRSGRVTLLVHNWRNRDLLDIDVRLQRR